MNVVTYPNVKEGLKSWLSDLPELATFVGDSNDHVFYRVPDKAPWPIVVIVGPVGGGPLSGDAPVDAPWFQFDCWGQPTDAGRQPREKQAADLSLLVQGALMGLQGRTRIDDMNVLWANVISRLPAPDPESGQARYIVTAEISAIAA